MKYTREELVEKYKENTKIVLDNNWDNCETKSIFISKDKVLEKKNVNHETKLELVKCTTIDAVLREKGKCIVLNFADFKKPGGMYTLGAFAQEESLCFSSNLYYSLRGVDEYYSAHNAPGAADYGFYNNDAILTKDVIVFRDSELEFIKPRKMDVITIPAPFAKIIKRYRSEMVPRIKPVFKDRCRRVLQVAATQDCDALILGAFGCGVFRNNIDDLCLNWAELLALEFPNQFKKVVFAVPNDTSYHIFNYNYKLN